MTDADLRPASRDELRDSISFALRFNGRKRSHLADDHIATIAAEHIARHLDGAGYVVMRKPPLAGHGGAYRAPDELPHT